MKTETSREGLICRPRREDYFECLHNKKEHQIVRMINAEAKRKQELEENEGGGH